MSVRGRGRGLAGDDMVQLGVYVYSIITIWAFEERIERSVYMSGGGGGGGWRRHAHLVMTTA